VPASRAYGIDGSGSSAIRIGSGRWDDTDGSIWNRVVDGTGRKDAFFAVYVEEEEHGRRQPGRQLQDHEPPRGLSTRRAPFRTR
jgi:hypothetical protein